MIIKAKDFIEQNIGLNSLELLELYREHILESVTESVENIDYNQIGVGCGLEDHNIEDRYESANYGWEECIKSVEETIDHLT
jgi:hypothetical protein